MTASPAPVEPPDDVYVRQRYIRRELVEWAQECDRIMMKHGVVVGQTVYSTRNRARYPARNLKRILVALDMREGWQLREHVERASGGWVWSVEYLGRTHG